MSDRDLTQMLQQADRPRDCRPEFDQSLRRELFGDTATTQAQADSSPDHLPIVELTQERRSRRSGPWRFYVAAAASVAIAVGLTVVAMNQTGHRSVAIRQPSQQVVSTVRAACDHFNNTAFGDVSRTRFLAPLNTAVFSDKSVAITRLQRFEAALTTLDTELSATFAKSTSLTVLLERARTLAHEAVGTATRGQLVRAADQIKGEDARLVAVARELTRLGVAKCL